MTSSNQISTKHENVTFNATNIGVKEITYHTVFCLVVSSLTLLPGDSRDGNQLHDYLGGSLEFSCIACGGSVSTWGNGRACQRCEYPTTQ